MSRLTFALAAAALACSGSDLVLPEDGGPPAAIAMVAGDGQRGSVGGPLDNLLVVEVTDGGGRPVADVVVEWAASDGSVEPTATSTDADGRAAARRILGAAVGSQTTTATSPGLDGSPVTFEHTALPGAATRLVKTAGDNQSAPVGTDLSNPLVVRLFDAADNPIPDRAVTWLVTGGGGTISPAEDITADDGRSSARWKLGSSAGQHTATAVVSGIGVVEFTAMAVSSGGGDDDDSPARIAMSRGNEQTVRAGTAVHAPPAVIVTDSRGRGVSGVRVTYAVIEGGGSVTGATPVTNDDGIAAVGSWTLGPSSGTNRLRATAEGSGIAGNPITFIATATVPAPPPPPPPPPPSEPDRLVFRVQPSDTEEDDRIRPAVQVAVVDSRGNVIQSRQGEVRLELRGGDDDDAELRGDTRRSLSDGVATFNDLRVNREGRDFRLRASVSGLASIESNAFDIDD